MLKDPQTPNNSKNITDDVSRGIGRQQQSLEEKGLCVGKNVREESKRVSKYLEIQEWKLENSLICYLPNVFRESALALVTSVIYISTLVMWCSTYLKKMRFELGTLPESAVGLGCRFRGQIMNMKVRNRVLQGQMAKSTS